MARLEPSVEMGIPKDPKLFNLYKLDDIDVYIRKGIKAKKDKIEISMSKLFWMERLEVDGIN